MTKEDLDYIIDAINFMFPSLSMKASDVESSWAGLRPLIGEEGKDPSEISRKDEIFISDSGLLSIAGGKLTGYRKMAEDVVDKIVEQLKNEHGILYSKSETKHIPLSGGDVGGSKGFNQFVKEQLDKARSLEIDEKHALDVINKYGSNVEKIWDLSEELKNEALEADLDPIVFAQLRYAMEEESVYRPVDFFIRRTGALFFDINWVKQNQTNVINYMAKVLNWTTEEKTYYQRELNEALEEAVTPE